MRKHWKKISIVGVLLAFTGVAYAQTIQEWVGHMVFRQTNPEIRFRGNLIFKNQAGTSTIFTLLGTGGASQVKNYRQTLSPTAIAAGPSYETATSATQTFSVTGLAATDVVFINGPTPTTLCPMVAANIPSTNTLSVVFAKLTSALCTPATGIYNIFATRS